jgi:polyribonucleotide nucleotidyltransferase
VTGSVSTSEAIIDNGEFGKRSITFEAGRLAQQAGGSAVAYLGYVREQTSEGTFGFLPAHG